MTFLLNITAFCNLLSGNLINRPFGNPTAIGNYRVKMTFHKASVTRTLVKVTFRQPVSTGNTQ